MFCSRALRTSLLHVSSCVCPRTLPLQGVFPRVPIAISTPMHRSFLHTQQPQQGTSMSKAMKIGLSLLVGGSMLSGGLYASTRCHMPPSQFNSALLMNLDEKVLDAAAHVETIPGLKAGEFQSLKEEIAATWKTLVQQSVLKCSGTDEQVRPSFVALQGLVEHVLSQQLGQKIQSLQGVILTPMPPTPLCSKGEISPGLVDPTLANDPKRLYTVQARTTIVRDFLYKGAKLYVVYPQEGMAKRTEAQQAIYQKELLNHPECLINKPLPCSAIPDDLIGAFYVFTDDKGNRYAFAIKMTQAKDPKEIGHFGLWWGSLENPAVYARVSAVLSFIEQQGVPLFDINCS